MDYQTSTNTQNTSVFHWNVSTAASTNLLSYMGVEAPCQHAAAKAEMNYFGLVEVICPDCPFVFLLRDLPLTLLRDKLVVQVTQVIASEDTEAIAEVVAELTITLSIAEKLLDEMWRLRELADDLLMTRCAA